MSRDYEKKNTERNRRKSLGRKYRREKRIREQGMKTI